MADLDKNPYIVNLLRIGAIAGVFLTGLGKVLSEESLQPNQHYSFIALALVSLAVTVALFVFLPGTTLRILKNPDLLVPLGLYVTADEIVGRLVGHAAFTFLKDGKFFIEGFSVLIIASWVMQIATAAVFLTWMTRMLLRAVETGRVELAGGAFEGFWHSIPRTLGVMLFGLVPMLAGGLILAGIYASGSGALTMGLLDPWILLVAVSALLWNLATAAMLPYVLSTNDNLAKAIRGGIRVSWKNKSRTILPVILLMLVSGWVVYVSVSYSETTYSEAEAPFGELSTSSTTTVTSNQQWGLSSQFVWTVDYPEKSAWHLKLMDAVKKPPLPSTDFRLMLLVLLLSLAVNFKIIESLWQKDEFLAEPERFGEGPNLLPGIVVFVALFAFLIPFEYMKPFRREVSSIEIEKGEVLELTVPKVYTGAEKFSKTELFRYEKNPEEKNRPRVMDAGMGAGTDSSGERITENFVQPPKKKYEPDPDEFELNDIYQVYAGEVDAEPGTDILAASDSKAFILTPEGRIKREFGYQIGRHHDGELWQNYNLPFLRIIDLDGDGRPEIAGYGAGICMILDLEGKPVWKYPVKIEDADVDSLRVGDIDNDGRNEVLVRRNENLEAYTIDGRRKWRVEVDGSVSENMEIADVDGDGKNKIVIGESIMDSKGKLIDTIEKPYNSDGFLNQKGENFYFLLFEKNKVGLFSRKRLEAKYEAPLSDVPKIREPGNTDFMDRGLSVFNSKARYVRFGGQKKYLAVLAAADDGSYDNFQILYIYGPDGSLLYHENIQSFNGEMTIMPNEDGSESLLVTDDGKLFKYSLN